MKKMEDYTLIKDAIDNYSVFSPTQKTILKILVDFDKPIPFDIIKNIAKASKQSFNFSIQGLLKLDFVNRTKQRVFLYEINREKIEEVINIYKIQKKLTKNT